MFASGQLPLQKGPFLNSDFLPADLCPSSSTRQDDVLLCPAVDLMAVRTGDLLGLHLSVRPELLFDGLAGGSEFGRGRASDEQTLNHGPRLLSRRRS